MGMDHRAEAERLLEQVAPLGKEVSLWDLQVLVAKAQAHATLYLGDVQRQGTGWVPAPAGPPWTVHDVVRHRSPDHHYYALLVRRDGAQEGWWQATVLKVDCEGGEPSTLVGQGVRLLEGSENNSVMQFPPLA